MKHRIQQEKEHDIFPQEQEQEHEHEQEQEHEHDFP